MSSIKLRQEQTLDMQQQARILVRVAVVANLLLAVVLSVMFFMKPNPEQETEKPAQSQSGTNETFRSSMQQANFAMALLPTPDQW